MTKYGYRKEKKEGNEGKVNERKRKTKFLKEELETRLVATAVFSYGTTGRLHFR